MTVVYQIISCFRACVLLKHSGKNTFFGLQPFPPLKYESKQIEKSCVRKHLMSGETILYVKKALYQKFL